jgi:arylsulfatase A-like enzyme
MALLASGVAALAALQAWFGAGMAARGRAISHETARHAQLAPGRAPGAAQAPAPPQAATNSSRPPNIVLVVADDLGYGDVGANGATAIRTPSIDRLASEGVRFTDFYVAQAVCSASRAAILTGAYPNRIGIGGALDHSSRHGIAASETTLAEVLKARGYATAIYGKWHLGHLPPFLPARHGFDDYYGLPYSNDMWPHHPERPGGYPDLPLIEGERVVAANPDQSRLTGEYTRRAVAFIEANRDTPFFLYVPHTMPHVPLAVSEAFRGRSRAGLYGDVVEEIDDGVGRILATLSRLGLDDRTLVVFTSDNGPWLSYGDHAGSAGPLREGKGTAWDGGTRVPLLARWPGRIPRGTVVREPAMTIDLLPTLARIAGAPLPQLPIDGLDIGPMLLGEPAARSPHESLLFYYGDELRAVRAGRYKLVLTHRSQTLDGPAGTGGTPGRYKMVDVPLALYDMQAEVAESRDVAAAHPEVAARMQAMAERARADLGDRLTGRTGAGVRPPGRVEQ